MGFLFSQSPQPAAPPTSSSMDFSKLLPFLIQGQQQQAQPSLDMAAFAQLMHPQSELQKQHDAWTSAQLPSYTGNPNNPFNNGFFKDSANNLTPEARVASQGPSATNQWAQMGGAKGINPQALQQQMITAPTMQSAQAPPPTAMLHTLPVPDQVGLSPFASAITSPSMPNPGFGSAQWPAYQQQFQSIFGNMMRNRTRRSF